MQKKELQNALAKLHKGSYTKITFISEMTPNKEHKDRKIQKMVSAVVRLGVAYSHINVESIQARKIDNSKSTDQLPWGEWDPECGYLITHKGNHYLRCTVSRSPKHHRSVSYILDGKVATKDQIMDLVRPSELAPRDKEEYVFNPKIENILALGKEAR